MPDTPVRESLPAPAPDDLARFGQFINWITVAVFAFGSLELAGGFIFQHPLIGAAGGLSLGYGACLLWARHLLRRGRLRDAVMLTAVGLQALILVGAPVLPNIYLYPALLLLPFVVVALALPYMPGREMRWLILIAWLVGVLIAITGSLAPPLLALPDWLAITFRIGAVAAALGLAFLLLWQYARRLNDTLAQSRAANRALQDQVARRAQAEAELAHERNRLPPMTVLARSGTFAITTAGQCTTLYLTLPGKHEANGAFVRES